MYRFFVKLTFLIPAIVISQGKLSQKDYFAESHDRGCRARLRGNKEAQQLKLVFAEVSELMGNKCINLISSLSTGSFKSYLCMSCGLETNTF